MKRVSTVELIRNFGPLSDAALAEPVIVTKNGRERLVLISVEQYDIYRHALDAYDDTQQRPRRGRAKAPPRRAATRQAG